MNKGKRRRLSEDGWRVGTVSEFSNETEAESLFIEIKLALSEELRNPRTRLGWTQARAARAIGSSQSRLAKMEAAEASVSLDLFVRALIGLGASRRDVAAALRGKAA